VLHFRSLTLENFGPYLGVHKIDLQVSETAPVVVIYGENTLGKTQLFGALRWCLYGSFESSQGPDAAARETVQRLNRLAAAANDNTLKVTLLFSDGRREYTLTRSATIVDGRADTSLDLRVDASVVAAANIAQTIGGLLHPQISDFFLFDAETLKRFYERLNDARERAFIRESIEQVLGVPALQLAQNDVATLATDALGRQAKTLKAVSESQKVRARLKALADEDASLEKTRSELFSDIAKAEVQLKEVREQLKNMAGVEADLREQETLQVQARDAERERERLLAEMKNLLASGWTSPLAVRLTEELRKVEAANTRANEKSSELAAAKARVDVLRDQSSGGVCPTCEQALPLPGPEHAQVLADAEAAWAKLMAETGTSKVDLAAERRLRALLETGVVDEYRTRSRRVDELDLLQYERQRALADISDRIQGHKGEDIRRLGQRQAALDASLETLRQAVKSNSERRASVEAEQQKEARKLAKVPGADPAIVFEAGFYQYLRELLGETIASYRETVRAQVERRASEAFLGLIRDSQGYGGLRISSDYHVQLVDSADNPRPTSEGGKQLVALALIGALKHEAVRGGPVVIDSPLGRLDLDHRANVLQTWIPSLASQSILLVQSGELTSPDAHRLLGSSLGREYVIERPSNNPEHASIRELR
jgi:DNA sulfur modification protein DndD